MKQTTLSIPFDADKLEAIRQFTPADKLSIEDEVAAYIDLIFAKRVPKPVQQFLENRAPEMAGDAQKRIKP